MANKVKGIVIDIGGDVTGLNNALKSVNKNINYTQKDLKEVEKLLKLDPKNTELLAQKQELLSKAIKENTEKLESLKKAKEDADKAMQSGTKINQDMYQKLQREIAATENKLKSLNGEIPKIEKLVKNLNNIGDKATATGKKLIPLTAGIAATGVAAIKTGIDFETAFAGVRKTTEATEEEYEELKQGILDMSKELPAAASEIAQVAEAAGQLGISKEYLLDFTRVMSDLGESTNLSSTEAASSLAKFANITGMSSDKYSNLGSTVVALGNNFATTESDIVSMATKLASTGELVGLNEAQIMALATAMSSVGIEAEAGGSAMSKLLKNIQMAVELGGSELNEFASIAGMTSEEFQKLFGKDAINALSAFIGGLNDTERNGKSAIAILDDMGLTEVRLSNTILSLANSNDVMADAIETANVAWNENVALSKEAEQRYATTESKLAILANKIKEIAIKIADILLPVVNKIIDKAGDWTEKFSDLDEKTKKTIITVTALVATIGPLLIIFGKTATSVATFIALLKSWEIATKAQTIAQGALNLVTSLTPYGVIGAGIGAVAAGIGIWSIKTAGQTELQKELNQAMEESAEKYQENIRLADEQITLSHTNAETARILISELYELAEAEDNDGLKKEKMCNLVDTLNTMIPELNLVIDDETGALNKQAEEVIKLTDNYYNLAVAKAYSEKISAEATKIAEAEERKRLAQAELTVETQENLQKLLENGFKKEGEAYQHAGGYLEKTIEDANKEIETATNNMKAYQQRSAELTANLKQNDSEQIKSTSKKTHTIVSNNKTLIESEEKVAKTSEEISKELLENAEKYVSDMKFYDKISLEDEIEYWENIRKIEELGTNEIAEIDKKLYTAKKELSEQQQKLMDEEIEKVKEITNKYNEQFEQRAESLKNFNGIFNKLNEEESVGGKELLKRLKAQVKEFEKWQEGISKLSERGLDEGVLAELTESGPSSLSEVKALLSLNDKQLAEYSIQYQKLVALANEQAISELGPLEDMLSGFNLSVAELPDKITYAVTPASTLTSEVSQSDPQEERQNLLELITQLIVDGSNKVTESIFSAIPDVVKMIINGQELASVTWKDFENEANSHGKNWYTREQVASIARSVMPKMSEE